MTRLLLALCFVLVAQPAFATWSIIAIDARSGEMVMASATCVSSAAFARFPAKGLMDVQAIIVPGRGIAAAQASVDGTRKNQMLIYEEIKKLTPPKQILEMLSADPAFQSRQFAILDRRGGAAAFTGERNGPAASHEQGAIRLPERRIYYSVQGNILKSPEVVAAAVKAFRTASGQMTDKVMAAMEAADAAGGDSRCSCTAGPKVNAPCTAKTAHVAYLLQVKQTDTMGVSHNDGKYSLYLSVTDADIKPTENANPVKTLRMRYDAWKRAR